MIRSDAVVKEIAITTSRPNFVHGGSFGMNEKSRRERVFSGKRTFSEVMPDAVKKSKQRSPNCGNSQGFGIVEPCIGINDMKSVATAISTINVPFHGAELYVVNYNGEPCTPMKPIAEGMGMDWVSQLTKMKQRFKTSIVKVTVQLPSDEQHREIIRLALRKFVG